MRVDPSTAGSASTVVPGGALGATARPRPMEDTNNVAA
jgi:hypothetical protein